MRARWNRAMRFSGLFLLSVVMIIQYQNCAAPTNGVVGPDGAGGGFSIQTPSQAILSGDDGDQPVAVIDPLKQTTHLKFVESQLQLHSAAESLVAHGICHVDQNGAVMAFRLNDPNGQIFESGFMSCEQGAFSIEIKYVQELACGVSYKLVAQLGAGEQGQLLITRRCPAVASKDGSAYSSEFTLSSQSQCRIEKSSPETVGASCSVICYDGSRVAGFKVLSDDTCLNM